MNKAIIPTPSDQGGLSIASEQAALARPLAELVESAIMASCSSKHTERSYTMAIGLFLQFLDQQRGDNLPDDWRPLAKIKDRPKDTGRYSKGTWEYRGAAAALRLVDAALVDAFRTWRELEGDSPNTATARVYAVRTFLAVAYRDKVLTTDQAQAMDLKHYRQRQTRDVKPTGHRLSPDEVRKLRSVIDTATNKGKRDLALIDLMLYAGLRCEEAATIQGADYAQENGRWWIVLTGKGSKTRRLKVHDVLYRSLSAWCEVSGRELGADERCLFVSVNKGDRIGSECVTTSVVNQVVNLYGVLAFGKTPRLGPHDLRRTCARNAYDNGASLLIVQQFLGHSDPKTTTRYIGAYDNDDDTAVDYVRY